MKLLPISNKHKTFPNDFSSQSHVLQTASERVETFNPACRL
ncbi:hypothetical protein ASAP_0630 [Asaia bogorensis]|uniref:Uncharacterized protein n=1 Tax=Asaia bogorensis TaxID=91915 RepID=A0A060QCU0_9PROT|nr:hypothetical protein ASAP_0630 [Asaia bogorensis]